jgi:WD40 repeat protein
MRAFTLPGHGSQVHGLAFTADSKTLVSGELGGQIQFWDVDRRTQTSEILVQPFGQVQSLAVDPKRRWLAVGQMNGDIRLFHFGEPLAVGLLKGHTDRVLQLAFLKDGRTLLSTGYDGSIRRWDMETQKAGKLLRKPGRRIDTLAVWEDGQGGLRLAITSYRSDDYGFVGVDDMELERLRLVPDTVALSPDGTRLACTAGANHGVAVWDLPGKTRLGLLHDVPFPRGLAFTPDGKHIVVEGFDHTRIYQTTGGKQVARVDHSEKTVPNSVAVSPDGRWLAVGTLEGSVRVWHLPSLLVPPPEGSP